MGLSSSSNRNAKRIIRISSPLGSAKKFQCFNSVMLQKLKIFFKNVLLMAIMQKKTFFSHNQLHWTIWSILIWNSISLQESLRSRVGVELLFIQVGSNDSIATVSARWVAAIKVTSYQSNMRKSLLPNLIIRHEEYAKLWAERLSLVLSHGWYRACKKEFGSIWKTDFVVFLVKDLLKSFSTAIP